MEAMTFEERIIRFRRDTAMRKRMLTPTSFQHPAKLDAQLLLWIVERYTQPGETILDPMAGSGTALLACTVGRNVVLVELEEKFVRMCKANWEKVRQMPQMGYGMGECQIVQGDARNLEGLLVDKCIFSPPYASGGHHADQTGAWGGLSQSLTKEQANYGESEGQIGQLPYGDINHGTSYLEAMLQIYQGCYRVLRPDGLMILVTKNFIRDQKEIRLDLDTIRLCEQTGFAYLERWYRELPAQSFWRIMYKRKFPNAPELKYEDVLTFKKLGSHEPR